MAISFDRVAHRYDETRGGERRGRELAAEIRPWLAPGRVLEVGVGTGVVATALAAAGTTIHGVDVSAEMARRAYGRLGPRLALGDAICLPVRDACVDTVLFVWALHLVGDVAAALSEAARALRPGGRIIAVHGPPEPESTDLNDAVAALDGTRRARPDAPEALAAAAAAAGLGTLHEGWTRSYLLARTPNETADDIEDKVWSYLWQLDEEAWREEAVPVIRTLRALPEPDRPRPYGQRHRLTVLTVNRSA